MKFRAVARAVVIFMFLAPSCSRHLVAQDRYDVKAHYDKTEVMIPMRDGVKLFTIIYAPKEKSRKYPILLTRTAYGIPPYGPDNYRTVVGPNNDFARDGYIVVYQDARGKFKSEGEFIHHVPVIKNSTKPDESKDTYDTIDWLVRNVPNNNGRVGHWGISWGGWQVSMGMIDAHPALKASSPQAPPQDQFLGDDHHSGGAFQLMYAFAWMSGNARQRRAPSERQDVRFDYGTPDGVEFFLNLGAASNARRYFEDDVPTWNDYMEHGTYDEYWQSRNVPKDLKNVNHAVLIVAGWFDAQDFWGPFRMMKAMREFNPTNKTYTIIGPWHHGGWGRVDGDTLGHLHFGAKTGEYYRKSIEKPFFDYFLKDEGKFTMAPVMAFETGANTWRTYDAWPPDRTTETRLYLRENGKLRFSPSTDANGADSFVSDPAKPVPYSAEIRTIEGHTFMVEDQRFVWTRPDVLVYQTDVLTEDVTIAGPVQAKLHVATTGTDADFVVKVIDVFPGDTPDPRPNPYGVRLGGFQMLLVADILRAKFRNSFTTPEPMVPNRMTPLEFPLGDRHHTFKKGHRIMVHIQSTWFPMFDRNPQTFVDIYRAKDSDYQKATHTVYRSAKAGSFVTLTLQKK